MTHETRILLILLPSVMYGGLSILSLLIDDPAYMKNPLRQDLWRAGHAHAGVWLILALVALRYVDEANFARGNAWRVDFISIRSCSCGGLDIRHFPINARRPGCDPKKVYLEKVIDSGRTAP